MKNNLKAEIKNFNSKHSHSQKDVWNALARQWQGYRQKPWKDVEKLMHSFIRKKGRILEIGCGNCRNLLDFARQGFDCYGLDFSEEMLKQAVVFAKQNRIKIKLKKAEAEKLPFKKNSFDYALSIATIHHLKKEDHLKALKEMFRVLKPNGIAIITAWNHLNPKFWKFLFKKETLIPWKINDKIYMRYYYFFGFGELRSLVKKAGFKIIKSSSPLARNIAFVAKKS